MTKFTELKARVDILVDVMNNVHQSITKLERKIKILKAMANGLDMRLTDVEDAALKTSVNVMRFAKLGMTLEERLTDLEDRVTENGG